MTPTKKLMLVCLLILLIGSGLFLWWRSDRKIPAVTAPKTADSIATPARQKTAAIDTAKDIDIIKAYYSFMVNDTSEWAEYKKKEHRYLTQTLIDKLSFYDDFDYFPLLPLDDVRMLPLRSLKIQSLGGAWYRVRMFDTAEREWITLSIKMVTDKDGRRKLGYAVSDNRSNKTSPPVIYPRVIKMNGNEQDGLKFLQSLIRSYLSLNHTTDLNAPAYRKYLCETFIDKSLWNDDAGKRYVLDFFEKFWDDHIERPKHFSISPDSPQWAYKVNVKLEGDTYNAYRMKLEKHNGHFVLTNISFIEQGTPSYTDSPDKDGEAGTVFTIAGQLPQFPGGIHALTTYLAEHITYPKEEEKAGHEGRVIISFVVKRDGSIGKTKVVKSVSKGLDEEALRVVRSMPAWEPGRDDGQPAPVWFTLPITFKLK